MSFVRVLTVAAFCLGLTGVAACAKHDPVPVSQCRAVVSHAKKVLGDKAESTSALMKSCKSASDSDRGCALAATSAAALMRCTM